VRDADNVERVAIKPESASEETSRLAALIVSVVSDAINATGRRLSEGLITPLPVFQTFDNLGRNKTDIGADGGLTIRDEEGKERVKTTASGLTVLDEEGLARLLLTSEGNETFQTRDKNGTERFRITREGDLQTRDESGYNRFAIDSAGAMELRDENGTSSLLVDQYGLGIQANTGEGVLAFSRSSGSLTTIESSTSNSIDVSTAVGRPPGASTPGDSWGGPPCDGSWVLTGRPVPRRCQGWVGSPPPTPPPPLQPGWGWEYRMSVAFIITGNVNNWAGSNPEFAFTNRLANGLQVPTDSISIQTTDLNTSPAPSFRVVATVTFETEAEAQNGVWRANQFTTAYSSTQLMSEYLGFNIQNVYGPSLVVVAVQGPGAPPAPQQPAFPAQPPYGPGGLNQNSDQNSDPNSDQNSDQNQNQNQNPNQNLG